MKPKVERRKIYKDKQEPDPLPSDYSTSQVEPQEIRQLLIYSFMQHRGESCSLVSVVQALDSLQNNVVGVSGLFGP